MNALERFFTSMSSHVNNQRRFPRERFATGFAMNFLFLQTFRASLLCLCNDSILNEKRDIYCFYMANCSTKRNIPSGVTKSYARGGGGGVGVGGSSHVKRTGCLSYLLGVKKVFLVPIRVYIQSQKVHRGASTVPFRY